MADRVQRLREAAQARHDATLRRAEDTLRQLAKKGGPITFRRVAEEAGVSRAWLYRQDQLRRQIDQLRVAPTSRASSVPAAERATADSLRQQLRAYRSEIARLRLENQDLREQLARQLGAQRAAANTRPG
jgi:TolA-binding protein